MFTSAVFCSVPWETWLEEVLPSWPTSASFSRCSTARSAFTANTLNAEDLGRLPLNSKLEPRLNFISFREELHKRQWKGFCAVL